MKYNIIGDIHGRTTWEQLVVPSLINIFVGDYFDPYEKITFEKLKQNFLNIIQFAKTNPNTILLLGNHDLHYIHGERSSRFDYVHSKDILQLFEENAHMFIGVAWSIENKVLISHAGFTGPWLDATNFNDERTPDNLASWVNSMVWDRYTGKCWSSPMQGDMRYLTFEQNAIGMDYYGTSPTQSPVWVRPGALSLHNAIPEHIQIVGHTQVGGVAYFDTDNGGKVYMIDCLGSMTVSSLFVEVTEDNSIICIPNKLK